MPEITHDSTAERTIQDFGRQWSIYTENNGYYASVELLRDFLAPLLTLEELRDRYIADIGSGSGRIVNMLLAAGAAHVTALEPSDAFEVLKKNTAEQRNRITYLHARGEDLPPSGDLDMVISLGVIHHIPDPLPTLRAAYSALKPGGKIAIWVYAKEGNELYLAVARPLRNITSCLPHTLLSGISWLLAIPLWIYIRACAFLPLPMRRYMRRVLRELSLRQIQSVTIYDQLNPTYTKYYTREEALALLSSCGTFARIGIHYRHGYSWTVVAEKVAF